MRKRYDSSHGFIFSSDECRFVSRMDPDGKRINPDFDRVKQPSPWLDHRTYEDLFAYASRELGTAQCSVKATSCALRLTAAVLVLKEQVAFAQARFVTERPI